MTDRVPLAMVAEAFVFGAIVPAGSLVAIRELGTVGVDNPAVPLYLWILTIVIGTAGIGIWRNISSDALLGGGLLGSVLGWSAFGSNVGFPRFAVLLLPGIATISVIASVWGVAEYRNYRGIEVSITRYNWRYVFIALLMAVSSPLVILSFVIVS